ncbi:2432_t:CDS:2, partial [Paraglomus occultum]
SVCILANVDAPHCLMLGYDANGLPISSPSDGYHTRNGTNGVKFVQRTPYSEFIHSTLHEVKNLFSTMRMPAESCLEYIEDRLRVLYLKTLVVNNIVRSTLPTTPPTTPIFQQNSLIKTQIANIAAA